MRLEEYEALVAPPGPRWSPLKQMGLAIKNGELKPGVRFEFKEHPGLTFTVKEDGVSFSSPQWRNNLTISFDSYLNSIALSKSLIAIDLNK